MMSVSDQTRKSLEKVGLTGYEIKTFTSLLKTGELTASDLSQHSGVPYSKIYEVLGMLEEKGWIGSDKSRRQNILLNLLTLHYKQQNKRSKRTLQKMRKPF